MIPLINDYSIPDRSEVLRNVVPWCIEPRRGALLVHDMQSYFLSPFGADSPLVNNVVANINRLRALSAQLRIPVFYTAQPPLQKASRRGLLTDFWGPGMPGDGSHVIIPELLPKSGDILLEKWRYDAFSQSNFSKQLAADGRDQLMITGVYAHIGCMTTAVSAFMQDIQPFLVSDAVADFSRTDHVSALNYVVRSCGVVLDTAEVLDQCRASGSAERGR